MAAVMKATSSARRKVAVASDVKIISYFENLKKDMEDVFVLNEWLNENVLDVLFLYTAFDIINHHHGQFENNFS